MPPQMQYLSAGLESLNVEANYAYNVNPYFLGQLTNLKYLYMKNSLAESDGIPLVFAALTNLEEFDCSHTLFRGPLREEIFQGMTQLRYLESSTARDSPTNRGDELPALGSGCGRNPRRDAMRWSSRTFSVNSLGRRKYTCRFVARTGKNGIQKNRVRTKQDKSSPT